MRDRFVTWGTREGTRRLYTFELDAEEAQIIRREVPPEGSTEDFLQTLLNAWNNRAPISFPAGTVREVIGLTATGTIVPDGAEVEDRVRVASAEREWPFDVVAARMRRQFRGELEEMRDVIGALEDFDEAVFERLKGLWGRVQTELSNKVLRYEHTTDLKKLADQLFGKLQDLRRGLRKQVRSESRERRNAFRERLAGLQKRLEAKENLKGLFEELKRVQGEIAKAKLSGDDRHSLRKSLDQLFKATKNEINTSGADAGALAEQRERLESRLKGLKGAIARMRHSVSRDNKDKFYEGRRQQRAHSQLAEQLAAAKLMMLGDRAESKQTKLDDMLATEAQLEKKLAKLIKREEKALERRRAAQSPSGAPVASTDGSSGKRARRGGRNPIAVASAALEVVEGMEVGGVEEV